MTTSKSFVFGLLAGVLVTALFGYQPVYQSGYESAQSVIKGRLEKSGIIPNVQEKFSAVSGTVKAIAGQVITLEVPPPFDPTADRQAPTVYQITIAPKTEVISRELNMNVIPKPGQSFDPFIEKTITLADIVNGSTITAVNSQPITSTAFQAISIIVNK